YVERVAFPYFIDKAERFRMQPPGVEHEDANRQAGGRDRVREDHVLRLQAVGEHGGRIALRDLQQRLRECAHASRRRKSGNGRFTDAWKDSLKSSNAASAACGSSPSRSSKASKPQLSRKNR